MPFDPATVEPAEAILAELAGLDLTLARHVHACATATEETGEVVELARAYQRVARSLRQTLALQRGEDDPAFDAAPLDAQVLEVCAVMDLSLDKAERWRDLPDRSAHRRSRPSDELVDDYDEGDEDDAHEPAAPPAETNGHA